MFETLKNKVDKVVAGHLYDLAKCYDVYRLETILNSMAEDMDNLRVQAKELRVEVENASS